MHSFIHSCVCALHFCLTPLCNERGFQTVNPWNVRAPEKHRHRKAHAHLTQIPPQLLSFLSATAVLIMMVHWPPFNDDDDCAATPPWTKRDGQQTLTTAVSKGTADPSIPEMAMAHRPALAKADTCVFSHRRHWKVAAIVSPNCMIVPILQKAFSDANHTRCPCPFVPLPPFLPFLPFLYAHHQVLHRASRETGEYLALCCARLRAARWEFGRQWPRHYVHGALKCLHKNWSGRTPEPARRDGRHAAKQGSRDQ